MGKMALGKKVLDKMGNHSILFRPLLLLGLHARHLVVFCRKDRSLRCTAEKMDSLVCNLAGILSCSRCMKVLAHKYVRERPGIPIVHAS